MAFVEYAQFVERVKLLDAVPPHGAAAAARRSWRRRRFGQGLENVQKLWDYGVWSISGTNLCYTNFYNL